MNEWICDDRPIKIDEDLKKMTIDEINAEFLKLFGEFIDE